MTVSRFSALFVLLLLGIPGPPGTTGRQANQTRTLPGGPGRPSFSLRVLTTEREGVVEVSTPNEARRQTLTCALAPYADFVGGFAIEDLDMDGHPDLRAIREFGAKWERYCIWLYDPATRSFEKDLLARPDGTRVESQGRRQASPSGVLLHRPVAAILGRVQDREPP